MWGLGLTASVCLSSYLEFSGTAGFSACEVLSLPCPGVLLLLCEPLVHLPVAAELPVAQQALGPEERAAGAHLGPGKVGWFQLLWFLLLVR